MSSGHQCLVDYRNVDYRAFIFVGGHVDEPEYLAAARSHRDAPSQLLEAARAGAVRELFEETAIDFREKLEHIEPAELRTKVKEHKKYGKLLNCQIKAKLYFVLKVTDEDFWSSTKDNERARSTELLGRVTTRGPAGTNLMLKLSHEHSSFTFANDPAAAAEALRKHSGGSGSEALLMAMKHKDIIKVSCSSKSRGVSILPMVMEKPVWASPKDSGEDVSENERKSRETPDGVELPPPPERKGKFRCCFC